MEVCWLIYNGVPPETAFDMDDVYRRAMTFAFSTFHGAKLDIDTLTFREDD